LARVCIHGHFYQPPRENPWLERVGSQTSAAPFADWNARITAECYRPCASASIRDDTGRILALLNTYARISFDAGPTLMAWLEQHAIDVHDALIAADRAAVARFGHGTAMAQAYNHTILPLCTPRDRRLQIRWGLSDFRYRFGRDAEGLWLPECAVCEDTLEALAEAGVRFTVLAPGQIEAVRPPGGSWRTAVDPCRPYRVELPSGRSIAVFVYDGAVAEEIAFGRLLDSGDRLYDRLIAAAAGTDGLAHTATDGESYGHHHRHGEMALAWALYRMEQDPAVEIAPYASYLADHPPTWQARIRAPSSWSCAHGVERWRSDCGCGTAPAGGAWRAPLRAAFDALRMRLDEAFEADLTPILPDPWAARDDYVQVLLGADRTAWLDAHAGRTLSSDERLIALEWLEAQRHGQLMFTSCGWFFEDVDRLEPVQDLMYAWRAAELAGRRRPDEDWRGPLLADLEACRSSRPAGRGKGSKGGVTAAELIAREVEPERFDLPRLARLKAALDVLAGRPATEVVTEARTGRQRAVRATVEVRDGRVHVQEGGIAFDLTDAVRRYFPEVLEEAQRKAAVDAVRAVDRTRQLAPLASGLDVGRVSRGAARWASLSAASAALSDPAPLATRALRRQLERLGLQVDGDGRAHGELEPGERRWLESGFDALIAACNPVLPAHQRLLFERALLAWPALSVHTRQRLERRAYDLTCAHHGAPEWAGVVQAARRLARIASRTLDVPHAVHTVEGR